MTTQSLTALSSSGTKPPRPTFSGAVRGELSKLRRNRPTVVMTVLGLLFLALVMLLFATVPQFRQSLVHHPQAGVYMLLHPLEIILAAGAGIAVLLTGSRLLGMEFDLGTVRVLFARGTGRQQLLLAKIAVLCLYGLLLVVGFSALSALGIVVVVQHQTGTLSALQALPVAEWESVGGAILSCAVSVISCAFLALAMAALLRSVTGGMLLAMLFFPIDNALSIALAQLTILTKVNAWKDASAFLYGPNLNHLPTLLQVHQSSPLTTLTVPAVPTALPETIIVILAWWVALVLLAMASMGRRDVLS
ncbi:MAG: ABC transporter permease [Candidatus Dormibacteria bacterium]